MEPTTAPCTVPTRIPGLGRVMVIDDDQECLQLACTALSSVGFEVQGLEDPGRFFDELDRFQPDALVLDRHMPGESGDMIAIRLRAFLGPRRPAVILWTADAGRKIEAALLSGIANDIVVKCQQGIDVLVQRVISQAGWDHVGRGLMLRRKDAVVLFGGKKGRALTPREIDFLYRLAISGSVMVPRKEGELLLLELGEGESSTLLLNQVVSRFKRKLPPALRAAFVTVRGKGWRLEL